MKLKIDFNNMTPPDLGLTTAAHLCAGLKWKEIATIAIQANAIQSGNVSEACRALGLGRSTFYRIRETHISPEPECPVSAAKQEIAAHIFVGHDLLEVEKAVLAATLDRHDGNRSGASRELGMGRTTMHRRMGIHYLR